MTCFQILAAFALVVLSSGGCAAEPSDSDEACTAPAVISVRASYYQQFDADYNRDVPAEGYGGWKEAEIEIAPCRTALVVMHAWQCGTRERFPGWYRAVEYIPRSQSIASEVFPPLLDAARKAGLPVIHVVGGGDYYRKLPGYERTAKLGIRSAAPEQIPADGSIEKLRSFKAANVFPGAHNKTDVAAGFAVNDFLPQARPGDDEQIVENSEQLFAVCRDKQINHLVYVGFAIDSCLLTSPGGMVDMSRHGIMCSTIRDATLAVENKETARDEIAKQIALWRIAVNYGFVFNSKDFVGALNGSE